MKEKPLHSVCVAYESWLYNHENHTADYHNKHKIHTFFRQPKKCYRFISEL